MIDSPSVGKEPGGHFHKLRSRQELATPHPIFLFLSAWSLVLLCYSLHWSLVLSFTTWEALAGLSAIVLPFTACWILLAFTDRILSSTLPTLRYNPVEKSRRPIVRKRVLGLLIIWAILSLLEVFISGGLPIVTHWTGDTRAYSEFGIVSLHGFLNAVILSISVASFYLFLITGDMKFIYYFLIGVVWGVLLVARQVLVVLLIEIALVYFSIHRITWKTVLYSALLALGCIILFGVIGDYRSNAEHFITMAQPDGFPQWFPSGFLWIYIYITTPFNNYLNVISGSFSGADITFTNTLSQLFPTVIRTRLFGLEAPTDYLVHSAFTTSTAFASPYLDMGFLGVSMLSVLMAIMAFGFRRGRTAATFLSYIVMAQCLLVSIFHNILFSLPVICQIPWFFYIFYGTKDIYRNLNFPRSAS